MSALGELAAALLPPEAGGPAPERVATVARAMIERMPAIQRTALGGALVALEGVSLARFGKPLGGLPPERRAAVLAGIARVHPLGGAAVDGLKTIVLIAAGADQYAPEIAATGRAAAPARSDPELALIPGRELGPDQVFDAIVVGSGAGGAFAARELARRGLSVLVLEEGEHWGSARIRSTHPIERFAALYRDGGATVAFGAPPIALPVGRAVGGTTVINSGTCYRPPLKVVAAWRDEHGLALAGEPFAGWLEDIERTIGVGPVPRDVMGRNGAIALAGAKRLGWHAAPLNRNASGCRGACQCAIGCPNNAKAGVHLNALPQACEAGAVVASQVRVERVLTSDGRATGVWARARDGMPLELRAAKVVIAAGALETPALLRRSGLARHPRLGSGLSIHPALGAYGRFAEPVTAWHGVLQSAGIEELHDRRGILLEATSAPPGMGSMVIPGFGPALVERIAQSDRMASLGAMIADRPSGRVRGSGRPVVTYALARSDRERLVEALGAMARVLLAAGAEQVELGGGAPVVRDVGALAPALARMDVRRLRLAAFHPTGTAAAGADVARHPVGPDGALRGVRDVWVADASIVPSCPQVNPQVSVMALAAGVGSAAAH